MEGVNVIVDCNRGSDGCFKGRINVVRIEWLDRTRSYVYPVLNKGVSFNYYTDRGKYFTLVHNRFRYLHVRTWPGSWACEEFLMNKEEVRKLLRYLKKNGWELEDEVIYDKEPTSNRAARTTKEGITHDQ